MLSTECNLGVKNAVLVIGGGGFYGRYLVNDLLQFSAANIIVASRKPSTTWERHDRVRTAICDLTDLPALEKLADGCAAIVHCAGPFHSLPLNPLHAAIRVGANYVDIAEDRTYLREVRQLEESIRHADISVLTGFSVAPAMEALFTQMLLGCFETLVSVRTFAAPDTRKHRGSAMFHTMLMGVGQPFFQPEKGSMRLVRGWTEPEWIEFPQPLGKRLTYLVLEMADLDLLPELFSVKTVEFKAGTEWPFLNRLLGIAANIRTIIGHPKWERFTPFIRALSWLVGRFGKDEGGVIFELRGFVQGSMITHRIALVNQHNGGLIPAVLASIGTTRLLTGSIETKGIVPVHNWITMKELVQELQVRGIEIWWQPHGTREWRLFELSDFYFDFEERAG